MHLQSLLDVSIRIHDHIDIELDSINNVFKSLMENALSSLTANAYTGSSSRISI